MSIKMYSVTDSNGGKHAIFSPQAVSAALERTSPSVTSFNRMADYYTAMAADSEEVQYVDPEATFFTRTEQQAEYLRSIGFPAVFSVELYSDVQMIMPGGAYFTINNQMSFYNSSGELAATYTIPSNGAISFPSWEPGIIISSTSPYQSSNVYKIETIVVGEYISVASSRTRPFTRWFNTDYWETSRAPGERLGLEAFWANVTESDDPFSPGGTSETGGGGGTFDDTSDAVPDSSLPTLSAANTGFTRIYNPTLAQVQSLAQYLWTNDDFLTTVKNKIIQLVENPMDAIIAFNIVPCSVPDGGTAEFKLMYIPTGVQLTTAAQQYVDVDCGTLDVQEYYGSALDYSPYTKISAFLPYIGTVSLNTDEVMGSTLQVKYRIDIVSGACVAKILINGNVVYQFSGHCAMTIPVTSADFSRYVSAIMGVAKVAISAGTGIPIGAADSEPVKQLTGIKEATLTARNPETGRQRTVATETINTYKMVQPSQASFGDWARSVASNTVSAVMGSKAEVEHSGSFSGNSGYLGVRRPYLIIERPRMCNPAEYGKYNGYPSMVYMSLGDCTGYTEVQSVQLTGIAATNPELGEIGSLLKGGVIL